MTARRRTLLLAEARSAFDALRLLTKDDDAAIQQGRLFVGQRRILDPREPLGAGQTVTLQASRQPTCHDPSADAPRLLEQREGILAVYKPAAWSSEPDQTGTELSLSHHLTTQLRLNTVHIATRLDVGVSGLVLVATGADSARHLTRLVEQGSLHRSYLALTQGEVSQKGQWQGPVENKPQGKPRAAITNFECLARVSLEGQSTLGTVLKPETASLVRFKPETGRRHQLRIHAARHGHALLGDRRYGGPKQLILDNGGVVLLPRILLQAVSMELPLPSGTSWSIHCPIDEEMGRFWKLLGGIDADVPQ